MNKLYLKIGQAAVILGFSVQHMYRLARDGNIPSIKVGKSLRFDAKALDKFMKAHARPVKEK